MFSSCFLCCSRRCVTRDRLAELKDWSEKSARITMGYELSAPKICYAHSGLYRHGSPEEAYQQLRFSRADRTWNYPISSQYKVFVMTRSDESLPLRAGPGCHHFSWVNLISDLLMWRKQRSLWFRLLGRLPNNIKSIVQNAHGLVLRNTSPAKIECINWFKAINLIA